MPRPTQSEVQWETNLNPAIIENSESTATESYSFCASLKRESNLQPSSVRSAGQIAVEETHLRVV